MKEYGLLNQTISFQIFERLSFTNFAWSILEYFVPFYQRLWDNVQLERWQSLCCSLQNISLYLGIKLTQHQRSVLLFDRQKIGGFLRPFVAITSSFSCFAREPLTGLLFVFSSSFSKHSESAEADSFSLAHFPTAYLSFW